MYYYHKFKIQYWQPRCQFLFTKSVELRWGEAGESYTFHIFKQMDWAPWVRITTVWSTCALLYQAQCTCAQVLEETFFKVVWVKGIFSSSQTQVKSW